MNKLLLLCLFAIIGCVDAPQSAQKSEIPTDKPISTDTTLYAGEWVVYLSQTNPVIEKQPQYEERWILKNNPNAFGFTVEVKSPALGVQTYDLSFAETMLVLSTANVHGTVDHASGILKPVGVHDMEGDITVKMDDNSVSKWSVIMTPYLPAQSTGPDKK